MSDRQYLVENALPAEILYRVGVYSQTCAHIEHLLWKLVVQENYQAAGDPWQEENLMKMRMHYDELLNGLKKIAKRTDEKYSTEDSEVLVKLISDIEKGLPERAKLTHGALFQDPEGRGYWLATHWRENKKRGRGKSSKPETFVGYTQPLPVSDLDHALAEANDMLETARQLLSNSQIRLQSQPD